MANILLGDVTAYAAAVAGGYTGTYEQFCKDQAMFANNASAVAENLEESKKVLDDVNTAGTEHVRAVNTAGSKQVAAVGKAGADEVDAINKAAADASGQVQMSVSNANTAASAASAAADRANASADAAAAAAASANTAAAEADTAAARANTAAAEAEAAKVGIVQYNAPQTLTEDEQSQARWNIGAAGGITAGASGEVIAVGDSARAPLMGMRLYGKSTQDGTPTPDAPVPIVSAGDGGSIGVTVEGANLLSYPFVDGNKTYNGITYTDNGDGSITANGTATEQSYYIINQKTKLSGGEYRLSGCPEGGGSGKYLITANGFSVINSDFGQGGKLTVSESDKQTNLVVIVGAGITCNNLVFKPMLNKGTEVLPYEPYKPVQTASVLTPDGLRGIPVSSGGNYTDENGQQWICDTVDFVRGVYVQRICSFAALSTASVGAHDNGQRYAVILPPVSYIDLIANVTSDRYISGIWSNKNNHIYGIKNQIIITDSRFTDITTAENLLASEQPIIYYALSEPIETPLTEEQLTAYRALMTNYPNTTVYTDAGAGIALDYTADTKLYIDNKFAALSAAILNN